MGQEEASSEREPQGQSTRKSSDHRVPSDERQTREAPSEEIHRATERQATTDETMKSALALLACMSTLGALAESSPWFYHGLEGPAFTTESNSTSGYEVRRYPRSFWTATTVTGKDMDKAGSEAF